MYMGFLLGFFFEGGGGCGFFLFSHYILICFPTSTGYFQECELFGNTWHTHHVFSMSESPVGDIVMLLSIHFYLLVKEMSEWIYVPSRAAWVGWTSCTHTSTLKLLIFHLLFCLQNTLQKMHVLEGSRFGWDITIPNSSWTLPLSQPPPSKPQLLTSALLWVIKGVFLCGQVLQHLHWCWVVPSLLLGTSAWTWGAKRAELGWHCCAQEKTGHTGALLHSAIDARTSFSWAVYKPWESKALSWGFLSSWSPKPWHCLSSHVVSGADKSKNRLHLAFLEGAAFVGQLGKWWHYKNQSEHRAALREEMLSRWFALHWARNAPLLKRYPSVNSICLLFWWQTVLILVSVSTHISQCLIICGNNH